MMRTTIMVVSTAAVLALAAPLSARLKPRAPTTAGPAPRDAALEALLLDARQTPPEFEADALLRIAQSQKVDRAWRHELLDAAFDRAYGAQQAYRRVSYGVPRESRQGVQALEYDSRLTRVSLQIRATQMMAAVDPLRARELFQWIDPGVEATPCEETLVPALQEYYTTLSMLARTTFPASQRAEALRFLELYLWRAHLPSEMPAVATAVLRFTPRLDEAQYLESILRHILEGGVRDPRGLAVTAADLVTKFGELEDADHRIGVRGWHLLTALRDYLKKHSSGPRCSDSPMESFAVEALNARVRRTGAIFEGVSLLALSEVRPSALLPGARIDMFWRLPDSRRFYDDFLQLRGRGKSPVPMSQRRTRDWLADAERLFTNLDRWNGSRESSARDFFCEKALLFTELLLLTPSGPVRTHGFRSLAAFLRNTSVDREGRALWFVFVNRLLELAHGGDRQMVLDIMETAGHPVLTLYARMERTLSRTSS